MNSAARVAPLAILVAASRALSHIGMIACEPAQAGVSVRDGGGNRLLPCRDPNSHQALPQVLRTIFACIF
jgi:hypothetical protein